MTDSEAIERQVFAYKALKNNNQAFFVDNHDDAERIINALEKQIPKKPDCIENKMWCCPICDNNLMHKWIKYPTKLMPKTEGLPRCMSCGQAIDWSDEE